MSSEPGYHKDSDAKRLVTELASAVRAKIKQRSLSVRAASQEMPVALATLDSLLRCNRVSLDTVAAVARWAGYDVALIPRGES